jgi:hypothetical protein
LDVGETEDITIDDNRDIEVGRIENLLELRPSSWVFRPLWNSPALTRNVRQIRSVTSTI